MPHALSLVPAQYGGAVMIICGLLSVTWSSSVEAKAEKPLSLDTPYNNSDPEKRALLVNPSND